MFKKFVQFISVRNEKVRKKSPNKTMKLHLMKT